MVRIVLILRSYTKYKDSFFPFPFFSFWIDDFDYDAILNSSSFFSFCSYWYFPMMVTDSEIKKEITFKKSAFMFYHIFHEFVNLKISRYCLLLPTSLQSEVWPTPIYPNFSEYLPSETSLSRGSQRWEKMLQCTMGNLEEQEKDFRM